MIGAVQDYSYRKFINRAGFRPLIGEMNIMYGILSFISRSSTGCDYMFVGEREKKREKENERDQNIVLNFLRPPPPP